MDKKTRKEFDRTGGIRFPLPKNWRQAPAPNTRQYGHGWVKELDKAYTDGVYAVLVRTVETEQFGPVMHAAIRNVDNTDIPWASKQQIKNELFGFERQAIEFFPRESKLVDDANMYHLWVLPPAITLPFGLKDGES